jgi:hypothetical protein
MSVALFLFLGALLLRPPPFFVFSFLLAPVVESLSFESVSPRFKRKVRATPAWMSGSGISNAIFKATSGPPFFTVPSPRGLFPDLDFSPYFF